MIGELVNGGRHAHPFKADPVASDPPDRIECRDAVLGLDGRGSMADGGCRCRQSGCSLATSGMRGELMTSTIDALRGVSGVVPGAADLVRYWSEEVTGVDRGR